MKKIKNTELLYGIHPIVELLKAKKRKITTIYTTKPTPKGFSQIQELLPHGVALQYVNREVLHKLAQTTDHQGVVAYATPFCYRSKFFQKEQHPFLLMLDSIQDVRNLGSIIRSAHCIGVDGIIITSKHSAPLNASALKSSAGLAEHMPIYQAPSPSAAVVELKKAGYNIYLAVLNGKDATAIAYNKPLCLVIGSEGTGITSAILNEGTPITLPQKTADISYNASVAAGILLFLIAQQK